MLHLLLGRAGAGKTEYLHKLLGNFAKEGRDGLILLVPEQDSFFHERAMLEQLGERSALQVEVLSFSRLANVVFRELGGHGGRDAGDAAQALCMSLALEAVRDKLSLFAKGDERMVPGLLRLRQELSAAAGKPDELQRTAERLGQPKIAELALILQAYDAILAERFGSCDPLQALCENLASPEGREIFAGKIIAADAFNGFTRVELNILKYLLEQAQDVYVTLCADALRADDDTGVFAHTQRTAAALLDLARQAGVPIAAPVHLPRDGAPLPRYQSQALTHLEQAFLQEAPLPFLDKTADINLCVCEDIEAECAFAARSIVKLLREYSTEKAQLRCRDFAVLTRDTATYQQPFCAALRRVGLPVFEDARQPVAAQPLMRLAGAALEIAAEGFRIEAMMRYLKTGLTGMKEEDAALLENYALLWRVQGNAWLRPWTAHPQGLHQTENERSAAQLNVLNALRQRAVVPLAALREALRDCTGISGTAAMDEFLQAVHVPAALKQLRDELNANGQPIEAMELSRVWDLCMGMLDQMAQALEDQYCGAKRFQALFALLLSTQTLGELPQSLDAVIFGAADRVRPQNPKIVFVLGLNDGVFPQTPGMGGLITDQDRRLLGENGFVMQDLAQQQLAMERLMVYRTLCAGRQQLFCSWALRNAAGDDLRPSPMVRWLKERFPEIEVRDTQFMPPLEQLEGEHAGFRLLCAEQPKKSELYYALLAYFQQREDYAPKLAALERAASEKLDQLKLKQPEAAGLSKASAQFSPSQAEMYAKCPFQYFCRYHLKLQPRKTVDFDPLLRGNILHLFLETLFKTHGVDALLAMDQTERIAAADAILNDYAARRLNIEGLPARVTYLFRRLRDICVQVLNRLLAELSVSRFRPVAFELSINRDQAVQPHQIELPDGGTLYLGGKADRVDCAEVNGRQYFRVVDYKSGSKGFSLGDIFDGLNLQMLVYLFAIWDAKSVPFDDALPAGVLYTKANDKVITVKDRRQSQEEITKEKHAQARAAGFVLEDDDVLCAMEEGGLGLYLPAKLGKPGNMLSLARLGKLRRAADEILAEEVVALQAGEIPALPLYRKKDSGGISGGPCEYCDYLAVCGREPGHAVKPRQELDFKTALERIDGIDD